MSDGTGKPGGCGGCLGLIVALFVLGTLASMCGLGSSSSSSGDEYGAKDACHQFVTDQLKSPSSADFSDEDVAGDGPWTVTGSVDAENSFGAKLRKKWVCTVRLEGDNYKGNATILE